MNDNLPPDKRLGVVNEAEPLGFCAVESYCVHRCLDDRGVPRGDDSGTFSLWGRVLAFLERSLAESESNR